MKLKYFNVYYQNLKSRFKTRLCSIVVYLGLFPDIIGFEKGILEHLRYSPPSNSAVARGGARGARAPQTLWRD